MTAITRLITTRKTAVAGIATAGAAAVALSLAPQPAHAADHTTAPTGHMTQAAAVKTDKTNDKAGAKKDDKASAAKKNQTGKTSKTGKTGKTSVQTIQAAQVSKIAKDTGNAYANNVDGWIRQALDIMKIKHIPGSYDGLHRNIMRESSGNPNAVNNWDINAQNGIPSKGLLQVIQPTFDTYHVKGTKDSLTDPVANIVAAANYAADRYGSMDNVNSAY